MTTCFPSDWKDFFTSSLKKALDRPEAVWCFSIPSPSILKTQMASLFKELDSVFYYFPQMGASYSCGGQTQTLKADGIDSILQMEIQAQKVLSAVQVVSYPGHVAPALRFFGAFPFCPPKRISPLWEGSGSGLFFLPRWVYQKEGTTASLSLTIRPADVIRDPSSFVKDVLAETEAVMNRLLNPIKDNVQTSPVVSSIEPMPFEDWHRYIDCIKQNINRAVVNKVVAARMTKVQMQQKIDSFQVFQRLLMQNSESTCFLFKQDTGTFVGATPETLLIKEGEKIQTEALAGTIEKSTDKELQKTKLFNSVKEKNEHGWVVDHLRTILAPKCEQIQIQAHPDIKELAHVFHLQTGLLAILRNPSTHILTLVHELHPTPAVLGFPKKESLELILQNEPMDRGLYAGPIGLFDQHGDGHFSVALRSGLLKGNQAYLFAGAGIVAQSDALDEYKETEWKHRTLMKALS